MNRPVPSGPGVPLEEREELRALAVEACETATERFAAQRREDAPATEGWTDGR